MTTSFSGKTVLITGVCGTVGRELLVQLARGSPARLVGLDNNESELFFLAEEYAGDERVSLYLGDVRDRDTLMHKMRGVDVVLHAAALKHVVLCERSPQDAVMTNILGVQNVIEAATANLVSRVLFTSSDKAVNPTNVMGTSKLMGERLMTAAHAGHHRGGPVFASTRFGNVLGSKGSVIPLFRRQIAAGGPVTLTDPAMTRFVMTLQEAVRLVMDSVFLACGGEVFVTKMPVIRIADLAQAMVELLAPRYGRRADDIEIRQVGAKPGEKLYEELLNDEETRRTLELEQFFVVLPAFKNVYADAHYHYSGVTHERVQRAYVSSTEPCMDRAALTEYLLHNRLLED